MDTRYIIICLSFLISLAVAQDRKLDYEDTKHILLDVIEFLDQQRKNEEVLAIQRNHKQEIIEEEREDILEDLETGPTYAAVVRSPKLIIDQELTEDLDRTEAELTTDSIDLQYVLVVFLFAILLALLTLASKKIEKCGRKAKSASPPLPSVTSSTTTLASSPTQIFVLEDEDDYLKGPSVPQYETIQDPEGTNKPSTFSSKPDSSRTKIFVIEDETTNRELEMAVGEPKVTIRDQEVAIRGQEVTSSDHEVTVTEQEVAATEQEVTSRDQEVTSSDQEVAGAEQEVTSRDQEVAGTDQEVTSIDQEVTSRDQEVTSRDQEVTSRDQEVTSRDQEVTSRDQNQETPRNQERKNRKLRFEALI